MQTWSRSRTSKNRKKSSSKAALKVLLKRLAQPKIKSTMKYLLIIERVWAHNPHPFEGELPCGTLGLPEEPETHGQNGDANEQGEDGIGGDDVPNDAKARDDDGTSFGKQAGSSDGHSVGDYLLYNFP